MSVDDTQSVTRSGPLCPYGVSDEQPGTTPLPSSTGVGKYGPHEVCSGREVSWYHGHKAGRLGSGTTSSSPSLLDRKVNVTS